ncbi:transketolase [Lactobacillus sp. CC-MHH1034]|uniref:transketolase n=1 Tax=Agrilactobacillus fermenti TaxID=2586909 RepID=UPI001E31356F|nr:transketolase [Agrilactobacillus fermenti]MCD2257520.1 transketolase [Agrilactobacillus fermenti]
MFDVIDELSVQAIRMLSVQMIQKANSGHPGLPLGAAPMAYVLFRNHLKVDPKHSDWFNRDRFVLSAGHGSALLYSLLHLSGFELSLDDLKNFRQLHTKTPGHPEVGQTPGVDATTGPLGQGIGMAVGMALSERHLASQFNRNGHQLINHLTYALCGDGDLMEGVSHEAASLAGHLKLGKLILLYDSNDISLDGAKGRSCSENTKQRFESYGWQYQRVDDGNDLAAIDQAIVQAKADETKPSIIEVRTTIGFGAKDAGTNKVHGAPLSSENMTVLRQNLQWQRPEFEMPPVVYQRLQQTLGQRGSQKFSAWRQSFQAFCNAMPGVAHKLGRTIKGSLPKDWQRGMPVYVANSQVSGRDASASVLQRLHDTLPQLWGGSADLASSNRTDFKTEAVLTATDFEQRNIAFGVREFAEATIMNGIALHGGSRIFGSTFLVFSDYMRPAIRLAALQKLPVIYIFTHDSLAVGEDGPTHEPVEQVMSLRNIPNVTVIRPGDANEVVGAWQCAIENTTGPTVLVLSRQALTTFTTQPPLAAHTGVQRGGYMLSPARSELDQTGILLATGSEVQLALKVQKRLWTQGLNLSVVSLPSFELFQQQSQVYREQVLPPNLDFRVSIEAGSTLGWERFTGLNGLAIGIDTFGASGRPDEVLANYGFTAEQISHQILFAWRTKCQLAARKNIG